MIRPPRWLNGSCFDVHMMALQICGGYEENHIMIPLPIHFPPKLPWLASSTKPEPAQSVLYKALLQDVFTQRCRGELFNYLYQEILDTDLRSVFHIDPAWHRKKPKQIGCDWIFPDSKVGRAGGEEADKNKIPPSLWHSFWRINTNGRWALCVIKS